MRQYCSMMSSIFPIWQLEKQRHTEGKETYTDMPQKLSQTLI